MPTFLVEIGVEDLPAEEAELIAQSFRENLLSGLKEARLSHGKAHLFWTLRRFALLIEDMAEKQAEVVEEIRGPAVSVGLDSQGNLTAAAQGFLRRYGAGPEKLVRRTVGDKEYLFLRLERPGRSAKDILQEVVPKAVRDIPCSKSMRWDGGMSFLRPIRWIVAILGDEVVPISLAGLSAGRRSLGHRLFGKPLVFSRPEEYATALREAGVMADPEERAEFLRRAIERVETEHNAKAALSEELWTLLLGQTEWPQPVVGQIPSEFLALPEPVVVAALREEGKFVPFTRGGRIAEVFLGFAEGNGDPELIRRGYERVVGIRLRDAMGFFSQDRRRTLASRVPELKGIVYEARLGTVWDRVERIRLICRLLARALGLPPDLLDRAALLCKADLLTIVVREFPELEGVMGGIYARLDGEPAEVAKAIEEHVRPRGKGDELPATPLGIALGLADKLDGVIGPIRVGEIPTGSRDPYGVRRRGTAVVRIVLEKGIRVDLFALIDGVVGQYPGAEPAETVKEFLWERLRSALEERGISYDVVEAVLAQKRGDFLGVWERAQALQALVGRKDLADLALAFGRVRNITQGHEITGFDPALFQEDAEHTLWQAYLVAKDRVEKALRAQRPAEALQALLELKNPIDRYFDEVLVMCEDRKTRENRLGFLTALCRLFLQVADLSRLVVPG
ncbi:MAG: glycine--tRNA ligase subunit beta [Candidatus Bipolaricaulota bacterium]|nr:glycine--tRNA ligase subunit beta [Candidatus Bipolaricaulota bacterium]MDW8127201.1 glycine--tRNA ligase subunit beta [Candidatus Bipolaricaulota bacterium]